MIKIVPCESSDRDAVAAMVVAIQVGEFAVPITLAQQPDLQDPIAFFRKGAGDFWVARTDAGAVVGTIALLEFAPGQGALRKMFVRADHRGAVHGVAQHLLDALLIHARATGIGDIWLGTTEMFKAAHRFYQKNGFSEVAQAQLPLAFPRMAPDTRFFRIALLK